MKQARIGIPRALLYHVYAVNWTAFFRELGYKVIVSPDTHAGTLRDGMRRSLSDLCLPVKIFLGHVDCLKDSVDHLFVPRYISVDEDAYMCPKLIGLPDMVRACFTSLPPILDPQYHQKRDGEGTSAKFARQLAVLLSRNRREAEEAFSASVKLKGEDREPTLCGLPEKPVVSWESSDSCAGNAPVSVGIIGRPYLVFDRHTGKSLFRTLAELGARPVLIRPSSEEIREAMTVIPKWVYWSMGREVVTSAHAFFRNDSIDGVINICSTTCGPDSFTHDLIRRRLNQKGKPYLSLSLDEHTSDVGIQTRIEAFIDMLRRVTA